MYLFSSSGPGSYKVAPTSSRFNTQHFDQPFLATQRKDLFTLSEGHHLASYIEPYQELSDRGDLKWSRKTDTRASVSDFRYGARHSEARKDVPEDPLDEQRVDCSGRVISLADGANFKSSIVHIPFKSIQVRLGLSRALSPERGDEVNDSHLSPGFDPSPLLPPQPRLATLPRGRTSDARQSFQRKAEDASALGANNIEGDLDQWLAQTWDAESKR